MVRDMFAARKSGTILIRSHGLFSKNIVTLGRYIGLILLLVPFIQSRSYSEMPGFIGRAYAYASVASSTIVYFLLIKRVKRIKIMFGIPYVVFWLTYITCTFIQCPAMSILISTCYHAYVYTALFFLIIMELQIDDRRLLSALSLIYSLLIILNFVLRFVYPNGLYPVVTYHDAYLLGDSNAVGYVAIPGMIIVAINSHNRIERMNVFAWVVNAVSILTFLLDWCATSIVCGGLWLLFLIMYDKGLRLRPRVYLFSFLVAVLLIVEIPSNGFLKSFVTDVLHKDLTYTGRTHLWSGAMAAILNSPFLGYGGFYRTGLFPFINEHMITVWYPCHTTYLQLLLDGGLTLFLSFCWAVACSFRIMTRNAKTSVVNLVAAGLFCVMFHGVFEYNYLHHLTILLALAMGSSFFCVGESE